MNNSYALSVSDESLAPPKLTRKKILQLIILVNLIIPLGGISTDIYLPSLHAISLHFHVIKSLSQFTVTSYILALGIFQIIAGPVSDAFGRKKLLLIAIAVQIGCVFFILLSKSIGLLIGLRFIQGAGAAFMMVAARSIINDVFSGGRLKKHINYYSISFAFAMILAPLVGSFLQSYIGWKANFFFIFNYLLLVLAAVIFIYQETSTHRTSLSFKKSCRNYRDILLKKDFLVPALYVSILIGYLALFSVMAPFIIQVTFNQSPIIYGYVALSIATAWFIGNMLNRLLLNYNETTKIKVALLVTFLAALALLILSVAGIFNIFSFTLPVFLIILSTGIIFPIFVANGLSIFKKLSASANGLLYSMTWVAFGAYTSIAILLKTNSLVPIAISYLTLSVLSGLFHYIVSSD